MCRLHAGCWGSKAKTGVSILGEPVISKSEEDTETASEAKRIAYQDYLLDCFLNQFFSSPHSTVLTSLNNDPMEDIPILAHNVLKAIEDSLASGYASTSRLTQLSRHFFKWSCLKHTERKKRLFKTVKREKAESDQKRTAPTWLQSPLASLRNWYKSL
ncbi:uncharacterized protein LOC129145999 isoform X8 [Talpa occidentalis]|uniref:uncharacterized protein LOC129145999 isoform X8 n=1 Tax=Talpa occidentalis TaxID=50954 RepID=UPI0023F9C45C|nr:uncharacterized protein LOC129145999 isoform X8 [Talpa occidentalis]